MGDVPADRQAAYHAAMADVVAHYADRYGVEAPEFGVYMGADLEAVRAAWGELGGSSPETFRSAGRVTTLQGTRVMFIYGNYVREGAVNALLLAHEYFHVIQFEWSGGGYRGTPIWMVEGGAIYESFVHVELYDRYQELAVVRSANHSGTLRDLEGIANWADQRRSVYGLGALATEWLIDKTGMSTYADYWRALPEHSTWEDAFASTFGITADDFHEAFEQHRAALLSDGAIGRIAGVVTGPGGTAVEGVRVRVGGEGVGEPWFVETPRDGTFELYLQEGTHAVEIHVNEGGAWRHIGWYGGDDGFTADVGQRIALELDAGDIIDIRVRLPADHDDLPEARIPSVRGTVLGPDGEPATGIGLWLWGSSTDDSRFGGSSADGTFDLDHQDGTFTLQIYAWEGEGWRHIGWYGGATGFTTDRAEATVIEVAGADVTGLEIRLSADPANLPTIE